MSSGTQINRFVDIEILCSRYSDMFTLSTNASYETELLCNHLSSICSLKEADNITYRHHVLFLPIKS